MHLLLLALSLLLLVLGVHADGLDCKTKAEGLGSGEEVVLVPNVDVADVVLYASE